MHILVFQHIAIEHPGIFRDFFREDGVRGGGEDPGSRIRSAGMTIGVWLPRLLPCYARVP